jgi:hypothetical protein
MVAVGRSEEREGFDVPVRLRLMEGDVDRLEKSLVDGMTSVDQRLGKIMWALVGLLISVCTTCIVLVLTLGVSK